MCYINTVKKFELLFRGCMGDSLEFFCCGSTGEPSAGKKCAWGFMTRAAFFRWWGRERITAIRLTAFSGRSTGLYYIPPLRLTVLLSISNGPTVRRLAFLRGVLLGLSGQIEKIAKKAKTTSPVCKCVKIVAPSVVY